ncbi:kinase [Elysia marginata]|uniref:Kinase n=1 Tax=Elysia marginata TaxID=1093978 RepID=A0AAV4J5L4_9GAST|nr:kinase [Elysia marginata]
MQWRPSQRAQLLAPFDHQVAGQSSMLVYDATTLCKPLIPREHFVYQTLPVELQEFTPQYRGEILVKLQETEGHIQLVGHAVGAAEIGDQVCPCSTEGELVTKTKDCGSSSGVSSAQRNSFSSDASQAHESSEASAAASYVCLAHEGDDSCATSVSTMSSAASHLHLQTHSLNPWSMKNHKRLLEKMRKSSHRNNKTRFMLLGNVVAGFKKPCILDLKIGSRLHGDDASSTKVASQTGKCSRTTSSSLGVRLCGMQVYQITADRFMNLDKYHGRTLTVETLQLTLRDFLHNGVRFRQELLQPIISRLAALITCVRRLDTYRFYASSLLIMYDGEVEQEPTELCDSQYVKHAVQLHKSRTRGFEHKNKIEDDKPSNISSESMDSKPRGTRSPDELCIRNSKSPTSLAASPSTQGIYDSLSTSTTSGPHKKVSLMQEQHIVLDSDSSTVTQNFAPSERREPSCFSPSCPTLSPMTSQTVCVPEVADDCLNMLTLSHSLEQHRPISSSGAQNYSSKHILVGCEDPLPLGPSEKYLCSSSHSCHIPCSIKKNQDDSKTLCSADALVKDVDTGGVSSSNSSRKKQEDKSLCDDKNAYQDNQSANSGIMKYEDNYQAEDATNSKNFMHSASVDPPHCDIFTGSSVSNVDSKSDFHTSSQDINSQHLTYLGTRQVTKTSPVSKRATEQQSMSDSATGLSDHMLDKPVQQSNIPSETSLLSSEGEHVNTSRSDVFERPTEIQELPDVSEIKNSPEKIVEKRDISLERTFLVSRKSKQTRLKVDVKMIDFAHTTHSGFVADKVKHFGPDNDYITGLENLKSLFECLYSHQDFG